MLNISNNSIDRDKVLRDQSSYRSVTDTIASRKLMYLLIGIFLFAFLIMFLPWTQNIRARGQVTTLRPENREQNIHSLISGRIERWYVSEGQQVSKGDTIVHISEMKTEYLDPELMTRAGNQTDAKKASIETYLDKADALGRQIIALKRSKELKENQAKNYFEQAAYKLEADSIDYITAKLNQELADKQLERQRVLYEQGLKSLTELEQRRQKVQDAVNKTNSSKNKWLASKNNFLNAQIGLNTVAFEYQEKIAKAESDRLSALSNALQAEGDFNKLALQQSNYSGRSQFYYITAPQDGFVTRAITTGIGETVKEGASIFSFVPLTDDIAIKMYVNPLDLPLIVEGSKVQIQFDGWPALVFSGWPNMSFGTYSGRIVSFDKVVSANGKFRVLVAPLDDSNPWPELVRIGSGAYGIALLKTVPVWYELWRNLNGFPPDFYRQDVKRNSNLAIK